MDGLAIVLLGDASDGNDLLDGIRFIAYEDVSCLDIQEVLEYPPLVPVLVVQGIALFFANLDVCKAPDFRICSKPPETARSFFGFRFSVQRYLVEVNLVKRCAQFITQLPDKDAFIILFRCLAKEQDGPPAFFSGTQFHYRKSPYLRDALCQSGGTSVVKIGRLSIFYGKLGAGGLSAVILDALHDLKTAGGED